MRRLFPVVADRPDDREWPLEEIADEYAYPEPLGPSGRWLRANMVSSLDGAAEYEGRSQPLSSPGDMRIFGVLRALADVVVVGAETVRREGYGPARASTAFATAREARGQGPAAAVAVVSAGLELDFTLPLFTSPAVPTLVVTGERAPAERVAAARHAGARVVFAGEEAHARAELVPGALAELGLRRQLTEGGPRLLGALAAAGVLDEVCLSFAPRLVGGGTSGVLAGPLLAAPQEYALNGVVEEGGFLFTRYIRSV
ncbi:pyrimidine reductase family protein [Streptomyces sulphureus]|uniref:pyrimidine reductase family protein n=1 Tax=Streptomyces sulphureus TaxID=47758 RepID=UPI00037E6FEC|nr:pyrimidine reductase family protein [Streptomyces sulphureus]